MNPFRALHEKLLRYPKQQLSKRICYDKIRECHCAMGAIASVDGLNVKPFRSIVGEGIFTTESLRMWAEGIGLTAWDGRMIQGINDNVFSTDSPAERYTHMLATLKALGELDEEEVKEVRTAYVTHFDGSDKGYNETLRRIMEKVR